LRHAALWLRSFSGPGIVAARALPQCIRSAATCASIPPAASNTPSGSQTAHPELDVVHAAKSGPSQHARIPGLLSQLVGASRLSPGAHAQVTHALTANLASMRSAAAVLPVNDPTAAAAAALLCHTAHNHAAAPLESSTTGTTLAHTLESRALRALSDELCTPHALPALNPSALVDLIWSLGRLR
jgi:hypothetical protein